MKKEKFYIKKLYIGIIKNNKVEINLVEAEIYKLFIRVIKGKYVTTYFFDSEKSPNALFCDGKTYYFHDNIDDLKDILKDTIKTEIGELTMDNNYKKLSIEKNENQISNLIKLYDKI